MKKVNILIMAALFGVMSLTACGSGDDGSGGEPYGKHHARSGNRQSFRRSLSRLPGRLCRKVVPADLGWGRQYPSVSLIHDAGLVDDSQRCSGTDKNGNGNRAGR